MGKSGWRQTAELVGIASIVASLIFVGLELRQSQRVARIDAASTRANWFMRNRDSVYEHANIWSKGNSGAQLTVAEQVIYSNLIRNLHTNNRFTYGRERNLGVSGFEFAAHELAWFLHKHPAALAEWSAYTDDLTEMRRTLMPGIGFDVEGFSDIVRADLEKLQARDAE